MMIIALDIGNTSVTHAVFKQGRMTHAGSTLFENLPAWLCKVSGKHSFDVVVSSVVPEKTRTLVKYFTRHKSRPHKIWQLGRDFHIRIASKYKKGQLGQDRLITLYGAIHWYGAPLLLIDYGTAVTFDYVSKKGIFEGGLILPGPQISFQALCARASLLPKNMRLPQKADAFLGNNTIDCMKAGILEGFGALTDGLIRKFRKRYSPGMKVIVTGGFAPHILTYATPGRVVFDPHLSVRSLYLAIQASKKLKPA